MIHYDIVYSILCHESIECVDDMISNVFKFNQKYNVLIILNLNIYLGNLVTNHHFPENVLVNPLYKNKLTFHISILQGHIDNCNYLETKEIKYDYFCPIASNCMFVRPLQMDKIKSYYDNQYIKPGPHKRDYEALTGWHWDAFNRNPKLIDSFSRNQIYTYDGLLEGSFYTKAIFDSVMRTIKDLGLVDKVTFNTAFEEIIPSSLEMYHYGFKVPRICNVYWHIPQYRVTIKDIIEFNNQDNYMSVVKRVFRNIDDPIRTYIRNCSNDSIINLIKE